MAATRGGKRSSKESLAKAAREILKARGVSEGNLPNPGSGEEGAERDPCTSPFNVEPHGGHVLVTTADGEVFELTRSAAISTAGHLLDAAGASSGATYQKPLG
ncbi:MAG: hypothetical protein JWM33_502 [Caulobacteraceae bacterium]|nr:hypothetical protein [Caulobacteraceae bacterium]